MLGPGDVPGPARIPGGAPPSGRDAEGKRSTRRLDDPAGGPRSRSAPSADLCRQITDRAAGQQRLRPEYDTKDFATAPTSWSVIYNPKYKGQVTVPDNPIQIADAALYLETHKPSLGITDPYELTQPQFQASVQLLAGQRPLIEKYWGLASQEIFDFKNGNAIVGAGWPYQVSTLKASRFPIGTTIPSEGATGWADTWMLAAKAPHPNCAYLWMRYISTPKVQAEQAVNYGETRTTSSPAAT